MKKFIYTIALLLTAFVVKAQVNTNASQKVYKLPKLDEHSIITDSTGRRMEYTAWTSLVNTGSYEVKVVVQPNGKGALKLMKLCKAQRNLKLAQMAKPAESPYFVTGTLFQKRFKEKDFDGQIWDTKSLKGKIVVLSFWYVNNVQCRMQIPDLNEVAATYKYDSNVVFLSVPMDDKKDVEEYLKYNPLQYKHLEKGKSISEKLGIINQPTDVVIDADGNVQYHTTGYNAANAYWIAKTIATLKQVPNVGQEVFAAAK